MVENTVRVWVEDFPTVLDPACGGGFFLLAAYQALLDRRSQNLGRSLTRIEREQILLNCIHGIDINPQAVKITRLSLLLKLLENQSPSEKLLPDLSGNIQCGNAVIGGDFTYNGISQSDSLIWEEAFPKILQMGGFSIIIGNPPYVDSEWMTKYLPGWRKYCASHYKSATGNWDLFCVFIEKSLMLCQPNGLISLVVPNKLASADYASGARSLLTTVSQILTLQDYSQSAAFGAAVYPLVFVAKKRTSQPEQQLEKRESGAVWAIATTVQQSHLLDRLRDHFPKLEAIAQVHGAATVAEAYAMQEWIQEWKEEGQALEKRHRDKPLRMVNSGTIDRYCFLWGKKPMRYLGKTYLHPVIIKSDRLPTKRLQQAKQSKIVVSGMTQRLECALDWEGSFLPGKSTSIIFSSQMCDLYYLLGVLNSRLISFYFKSFFGGNSLKGDYLRIGSPQLRQLPICLCENPAPMIKLVRQRLKETISSKVQRLDRKIDQLVFQIYELTDLEIQIIEQAKL